MSACRRTARTSNRHAGFTLLEVMVVTVLLGGLIAVAYDVFIAGLRVANAASTRERIRLQLAQVLDRLTREAATARNVDRAQATRFQFDADYDGSGGSSGSEDNVNYNYDSANSEFERDDSGGSTVVVADHVTSIDYDYIDDTGTTYTTCDSTSSCGSNCCRSEVRAVLVTMTATIGGETISVTDAATLRNRP